VNQLWDTWDDDAFIHDRKSGLFFDPKKQHAIHHEGKFFKVDGALNIARSPQGHPVIIQAGASDTGLELAARTAEIVFASASNPQDAKRGYDEPQGPHGQVRPRPRPAQDLGRHPRGDRPLAAGGGRQAAGAARR